MSTRAKPHRYAIYVSLRGKVVGRSFRYPDAASPAEAIEKALAELTPGQRGAVVGVLVRLTTKGG